MPDGAKCRNDGESAQPERRMRLRTVHWTVMLGSDTKRKEACAPRITWRSCNA